MTHGSEIAVPNFHARLTHTHGTERYTDVSRHTDSRSLSLDGAAPWMEMFALSPFETGSLLAWLEVSFWQEICAIGDGFGWRCVGKFPVQHLSTCPQQLEANLNTPK